MKHKYFLLVMLLLGTSKPAFAQDSPPNFRVKKLVSKRTVLGPTVRGYPKAIAGTDANSKWEIRSSTTPYLRCVIYLGVTSKCKPGAYYRGFESVDRQRFIAFTQGSLSDPVSTPALHFFAQGRSIKDIELTPYGQMLGRAAMTKDLFFAAYQTTGGVILDAYNFSGKMLWRREFADAALSMVSEKKSSIDEQEQRIILTLDANLIAHTSARTLIIDLSGRTIAELKERPGAIEKLPGRKKLVIWNTAGYSIYDCEKDTVTLAVNFPRESGVSYRIGDISSDGRKILVFREKKEDFKRGTKKKIEKAMIVNLEDRTVDESELDTEVDGAYQVKFSPHSSDSVDLELKEQTIRHAFK